jgi:hypothetical protein
VQNLDKYPSIKAQYMLLSKMIKKSYCLYTGTKIRSGCNEIFAKLKVKKAQDRSDRGIKKTA